MPGDVPRISVVVAPIHSGAALGGALAALDAQVGAPAFEVIVPVDASVAGLGALKARFPRVRFIDVEGTAALAKSDHMGVKHEAIDRRRAAGLAAARAPIIALTEEHARPDPDWCARLAALHADLPHAVIGGAIENANGRVINHALFLADAGRYQNPGGLQDFVAGAASMEGFFGRQHYAQPLLLERTDEGYLLTSYWMVLTQHAGATPFLVYNGWYQDTCVLEDGHWRFRKKVIRRWDHEKRAD